MRLFVNTNRKAIKLLTAIIQIIFGSGSSNKQSGVISSATCFSFAKGSEGDLATFNNCLKLFHLCSDPA